MSLHEMHRVRVQLRGGIGRIEIDGQPIHARRVIIDTVGPDALTEVVIHIPAADVALDIEGANIETFEDPGQGSEKADHQQPKGSAE